MVLPKYMADGGDDYAMVKQGLLQAHGTRCTPHTMLPNAQRPDAMRARCQGSSMARRRRPNNRVVIAGRQSTSADLLVSTIVRFLNNTITLRKHTQIYLQAQTLRHPNEHTSTRTDQNKSQQRPSAASKWLAR